MYTNSINWSSWLGLCVESWVDTNSTLLPSSLVWKFTLQVKAQCHNLRDTT